MKTDGKHYMVKNHPVNIVLRDATIEDLPVLKKWDEQPHIIHADPNDDWNWESELLRKPDWREQLIAELDGRPIGFIQIIDPAYEETHYWGDTGPNKKAIDIWIGAMEDLGKGYGTIMMQMALVRSFQNETITEILIDPLVSNAKAIRFYQRLGFSFLDKRTFGDDECLVYHITREHWNHIYNQR